MQKCWNYTVVTEPPISELGTNVVKLLSVVIEPPISELGTNVVELFCCNRASNFGGVQMWWNYSVVTREPPISELDTNVVQLFCCNRAFNFGVGYKCGRTILL